ncbi:RAD protein (Pv-fam-e) [Plasmodium vivax]|uniref:RAD protein (Pv-fam-e) n=1 Tax=Plasmodium vivax TaxID=5855 RepID=A0A1G4GTP9_PLAVI|nr:RAD protein (Pv-fam-e) [Plasmodium vivax]
MFNMPSVARLFFALLIIPLNLISLSYGNKPTQREAGKLPRKLPLLVSLENEYMPRIRLNQENGNDIKAKPPQGRQKESHSSPSQMHQVNTPRRYKKMLFLTSDEIILSLDVYNTFLNRVCEIMMERLLQKLNELSKCGVTVEEKKKMWAACKKEIANDLEEVEEYYQKICDTFLTKSWVLGIRFNRYLKKYVKIWHDAIKRNEKKWSDHFAHVVEKFGAVRGGEAVRGSEAV